MANTGAQYATYIKNNLPKAIPPYQQPDKIQKDALLVFSSFKDLRPRMDSYVFNDGQKKTLLCIDGTIPVYYKGMCYNIPICIWIMDTHPYNPPLCFVKPTREMLIKPSKYVDSNGKVYLPYLHDWKNPTSDLLGLIQVMATVFGECSPVFSRSAQQASQPPPRPSYQPSGGQPPATQAPYPSSGGYNMPMPMSNPQTNPQSYNTSHTPATSYQSPSTQYPSGGYPSAGYPGGSSQPSYPYPPTQSTGQTQYPVSDLPVGTTRKNSGISDDEIKTSIRSAVEDKLKRRLKDSYDGIQAEMDSLTITKDKLKGGQQQLEEMINKLEAEQVELEKNIQLLQQKDEDIKQALSKMNGQDQMDIDEAIVPTAPLYKQLLNLFAEEMTIEDTYYYLMEALRKNTIELEAFLKHVRELSRKQFLLRAHIQKVRQTAGLRDLVM